MLFTNEVMGPMIEKMGATTPFAAEHKDVEKHHFGFFRIGVELNFQLEQQAPSVLRVKQRNASLKNLCHTGTWALLICDSTKEPAFQAVLPAEPCPWGSGAPSCQEAARTQFSRATKPVQTGIFKCRLDGAEIFPIVLQR